MLRSLYDWTMRQGTGRYALAALALVAFAESSFFPIPPDVLLVPIVLAARDRAWLVAGICTVASVVGGFAGYGIGYLLFEQVGRPILEFYGQSETFAAFAQAYNEWGAWIVAGAGLTPFPYKVITIASGVTELDPLVFGVASTLSRGARFFIEAALLWHFGPPLRRFIEQYLGWVAAGGFALLVGGFVLVRYVL